MNNIAIVGRLTKDVETGATNSGIEYARFNVAVQSEFKTADGERKADFFPCIAWRDTANNIAKYFKKGNPIGVVGSINSRTYERADGTSQVIWEINVKNFSFVGSSSEETSKTKTEVQTSMKIEPLDEDTEVDLPF